MLHKLTSVKLPCNDHIVDAYPIGPRIIHVPRRQSVVYIESTEIVSAELVNFNLFDGSQVIDAFDYYIVVLKNGNRHEIIKDDLADTVFV
jgi:hypothetical protein